MSISACYNNYNQALKIISAETRMLTDNMASMKIAFIHNLDMWECEEQAYFRNIGQEKQWDVLAAA